MLYLQTGTNSITTTLSEKSTLANPYYTWEIIRKGSFESIFFYNDDNSPNPEYYNTFTFSLGTFSNPQYGYLDANEGEYTYNVYQKSSPNSITISSSDALVETGIMIITTTYSIINSYTASDNNTIIYYNNL